MVVKSGDGTYGSWHTIGRFSGNVFFLRLRPISRPDIMNVQVALGEAGSEEPFYGVVVSDGTLSQMISVPPFIAPDNARVAIRINANGGDVDIEV